MEELTGKINYLIGNDSSKWQTGVPTFAKVSVVGIYPGIDLVYYGNQHRLEYDFTVAPRANPDSIVIHFAGTDKISVNAAGELILDLGDGEIIQPRPDIYQLVNGARREINGGYKLVDARTVAFSLDGYDHNRPLVIDPILSYSTYFGGNGNNLAWAVAVDTNGFVYMAGQTTSTESPTGKPFATPGAFQTTFQGGSDAGDAFIAKFDNLGTNLIYLTYLGGNGDDAAFGLAVDAAGDAYVTGATVSPNFPVKNALYPNIHGTVNPYSKTYLADGFIAELDSTGSNLVYSTYLGGNDTDAAKAIALDSSGNAYVTGYTFSTNFPVTANAFQKNLAVSNLVNHAYYDANAFVSEIGAGGTPLVYSSYLGGNYYDVGQGIAVDQSNYVYVAGFTASTNFPTRNAVMQTVETPVGTNVENGNLLNGTNNQVPGFGYDAFVTKFAPGFSNLVYSTYLGGANNDLADGVAADAAGNAYVIGWTVSTNFPITVTNLPGVQNGLTNNVVAGGAVTTNAFLTQIVWSGTNAAIGQSLAFGGTNYYSIDIAYGVALDPSGNIYVTGSTSSTNFPAVNTAGSLAATNAGENDAFIIAFNRNLSGVMYSASLGGAANDMAYGIAVDPLSNAYIVGQTFSANFPTNHAMQTLLYGADDAFLAKIVLSTNPPPLSVSLMNGLANVTWSSALPYEPELTSLFLLESTTNLVSTNWTAVPAPPVLSNNIYSVVFNPTNNAEFFRLAPVQP